MEALNEITAWLKQNRKQAVHRLSKRQNGGKQILFTGNDPSAKLAAAQKLAQDAGKEIYRVDPSQVVSRYIGETEKNLNALFEKAASKGAVLLFDEADALFGKRTDVKDAHDRYANLEVSYLWQKAESYPGVVIFSLSKKANVDAAFVRRLRYVVEFD